MFVQPIHTILLHESPDLDAAFSSWLLRRFGEAQYPGVREAALLFKPVGELPDGLTPDELECAGVLAVDTGGGRLDNHGQPTPTSSALLVAGDLRVDTDRALEKLLRFVHRNDTTGQGISSKDPTDQLLSLPTILRGLNVLFPDDPGTVVDRIHGILDSLYATELEWFGALADADRALWISTEQGGRVIGITSESSAAMKAGRSKKADLVVHRSSRFIGITLTRRGKFDMPPQLRLAASLLRSAECLESGAERCVLTLEESGVVGVQGIWFLHESLSILSNGSSKNTRMPQSRIPWEAALELVACGVDPSRALPALYCDARCERACRLGIAAQSRCRWRRSPVSGI